MTTSMPPGGQVGRVSIGTAFTAVVRLIGVSLWLWGIACRVVGHGDEGAFRTNSRAGMTTIPAGEYRPLFRLPDEPEVVRIGAFLMETNLVTNGDFLRFVRANPKWQRSAVKRLFADEGYLAHWGGDLELGPNRKHMEQEPVVRVSWFAAKAYAAWLGRRLPLTSEWEYVAAVGYLGQNGAVEPEFMSTLMKWYASPAKELMGQTGQSRANLYGVYDLHGLVWEWTADFNSEMASGDARGDTGIDRQLFCGAGSLGVEDRANYPAFMRRALRSSLRADYTLGTVGFRCVFSEPPKNVLPERK